MKVKTTWLKDKPVSVAENWCKKTSPSSTAQSKTLTAGRVEGSCTETAALWCVLCAKKSHFSLPPGNCLGERQSKSMCETALKYSVETWVAMGAAEAVSGFSMNCGQTIQPQSAPSRSHFWLSSPPAARSDTSVLALVLLPSKGLYKQLLE